MAITFVDEHLADLVDIAWQTTLGEQCDDGNKIAADGCDEYCHWTCGNGRIETGEQCDPGSVCSNGKSCSGSEKTCPGECHRRDSPDCDNKCLGRCGNGVKDPGEECDPGRRCSFSGGSQNGFLAIASLM